MTTDVSKFSMYAVLSAKNVPSVSKLSMYVVANSRVSSQWHFSYEIEPPRVEGSWSFDYLIEQGNASGTWGFDYEIRGPIAGDWDFSYLIGMGFSRSFSYNILNPEDDQLGYRHVYGASTDLPKVIRTTTRSASTIAGALETAVPGPLTDPEIVDIGPGAVVNVLHFYEDYFNRIWVAPTEYRLSNPKIGFEYGFSVWNAYDRPNDLEDYTPTDLDGVTFTESGDIPITFADFEFRTLHFSIDPDAPAQIDGRFDFDFTMGRGGFSLFALVLGIMRTLPNEPMIEAWSWSTTILTSRDGTEQRMCIRDQPRNLVTYDVRLLDQEDRVSAYQQLYSFASRSVLVPFFQYTTPLDAPAEEGDTILYFDISQSDVRADEYLIAYNPSTEEFIAMQVASLNTDGVDLLTPLSIDLDPEFWEILPGRSMRLPNRSSLGMGAVDGSAQLRAESTIWREVVRPGSTVVLEEYDGMTLLPWQPIAETNIDETFLSDTEVIDNDSAEPVQRSTFTNPFVESTKSWLIDRETDMDWWRAFFDHCKGRMRPFLLPTWRDDLPLVEPVALGDISFLTNNADFVDYFAHATYGYLMLRSANGTKFRKVEAVDIEPLGIRVSMDDTIGLVDGDELMVSISFANIARLNDDVVEVGHFVNHSIVTLDVRTVNA